MFEFKKIFIIVCCLGIFQVLNAKIIFREDFENKDTVLKNWQTTGGGKVNKKILNITSRKHSGKSGAIIGGDRNSGRMMNIFMTRTLPPNKGGVLTLWVYDNGDWYSGTNLDFAVTDQKDRETFLTQYNGSSYYFFNNLSGYKYYRKPGEWHCFQLVLGKNKTKGCIEGYIDGRLMGKSQTGSTSFKTVTLGHRMLFEKIFIDELTLDNDPNSIDKNIFNGIDVGFSATAAKRPGYVFYDNDKDITFNATLNNFSDKFRKFQISGKIVDESGKCLVKMSPQECTLKASENKEVKISLPVPARKGRLYVDLELKQAGKIIGNGTLAIGVTFNPKEARKYYDNPFGICMIGNGSTRGLINKEIGAKFYSCAATWKQDEPEKGKFNWNNLDRMLSTCVNDPEAILMIHVNPLAPKWLKNKKGSHKYIPANTNDLRDYARALAKRYSKRVKYWSYWEEPFGYMSLSTYFSLLKAFSAGIKEIDPDAKIVAPSGVSDALAEVTKLFKAGGSKYIDILGHHFYTNQRPEDYQLVRKINIFKDVMKKYGNDIKPIWDTECGLYIAGIGKNMRPLTIKQVQEEKGKGGLREWYYADEEAAAWTVRKWVIGYANGLSRFLIQKSTRQCSDTSVSLTGLALSALAHEISGAKFVKALDLGSKNLYGYIFTKNKKNFGIFWAVRNSGSLELDLGKKEYTRIDMFGNERIAHTQDGKVELTLTEQPIYLKNISSDIKVMPKFLTVNTSYPIENSTFKLGVKVRNNMQGKIKLKFPDGWTVTKTGVEDKNGLVFKISVPKDTYKGTFPVSVSFKNKSGKVFTEQTEITLLIPIYCSYLKGGIKIDGNLEDWPKSAVLLSIKDSTQVIRGMPSVMDTQTLQYQIAQGARFWQGADDLSATMQLAWDDKYLYVGMKVTDPNVMNDYMRNPYMGDSVEMFLDTRNTKEGFRSPGYTEGVYHLRFVPQLSSKDSGKQVGYFAKQADNKLGRRREFILNSGDMVYDGRKVPTYAANNRFASKTDKKGYTMEVAIPFSSFKHGRPKPGEVFGFDIMLNDQDYKNEVSKALMCWFGNGTCSKNPSVFGKIQLKK